jgi:hypothetical protein
VVSKKLSFFYIEVMRFFRPFFLSTLFLQAAFFADEERSYTYWDVHPLHLGANAICLSNASLSGNPYGGDLTFNKEGAFVYLLVPINEKNFFIPRVEWTTFEMNWDRNPKFEETRFNYVQFALTFFTNQLDQWRWILRSDYNMDTDHFGDSRYGLFSALIWGSYDIWPNWHYHVGAYAYSGMKGSQVYPLIGFDYKWGEKWLLLFIFPIDYMLQYKFNENWSLALKGKPLKERFRTNSSQTQPRSIFSYSSIGAELNLRYEVFLRIEAEIFAGGNFGGNFYIKDQWGHNSLYTEVGFAPYGGANLNYGF